MKLYIKSKGNGWFTVANNYKDKDDSTTVGLYFPKDTEPSYEETEDGKAYTIAIDPQEFKLTCYKGKVGMTIFKYEVVAEEKLDRNVKIDSDALPFY